MQQDKPMEYLVPIGGFYGEVRRNVDQIHGAGYQRLFIRKRKSTPTGGMRVMHHSTVHMGTLNSCFAGVQQFARIHFTMVHHCCVVGCSSKSDREVYLRFHRFPADKARRAKGIAAVRRQDWHPTSHTRVCGLHFVSGMSMMKLGSGGT